MCTIRPGDFVIFRLNSRIWGRVESVEDRDWSNCSYNEGSAVKIEGFSNRYWSKYLTKICP